MQEPSELAQDQPNGFYETLSDKERIRILEKKIGLFEEDYFPRIKYGIEQTGINCTNHIVRVQEDLSGHLGGVNERLIAVEGKIGV
jgi:hypothetical protein